MDAPADAPAEETRPVDPDGVEEIEVVAERRGADEATFAVTVVPVDDRLAPSADVATAVQRAPGVHVQRLGGLGDWSSVSIRGGTVRQVEVFLDGLPLNPEGGGAANLSELPLWAFERVEVTRGLAPLSLDTAAMGGAVQLVTRRGGAGGFAGTLSGGSWGTVRAQALSEGPLGEGPRLFLAVDGLATEGNAPWFDDGGTRGLPDDDVFRTRRNNDTAQGSGVVRLRSGDDGRGWSVTHLFLGRDEGVPGTTFSPLSDVRYRVQRHLPALEGHGTVGALHLSGRVFGVHRDEVLDDVSGELGAAGERRTLTQSLGVRVQGDVAPTAALGLSTMASGRRDFLDGAGVRTVGRAGVEGSWSARSLQLSATGRLLGADGELWAMPRAGLRVGSASVALRAGAGRGVRIPDLTERYGDRGVLVGNPDLRAEEAWTADGSILLSHLPADGPTARVELGGFLTDSRDRIVWARNAQGLARPDNVARASLRGLEGSTSVGVGPLDLSTSASWTVARDLRDDPAYAGNQLPGVPGLELWHRTAVVPEVGGVELGLSHELSFTAGTFDDPTNFYRQAPRALQAATGWVRRGPWRLGVDVRNLTDRLVEQVPRDPLVDDGQLAPQPLEDFAGLPLVGRTVLVSLGLDPTGARRAR